MIRQKLFVEDGMRVRADEERSRVSPRKRIDRTYISECVVRIETQNVDMANRFSWNQDTEKKKSYTMD